jgi:crossover junction endodeoxyribonuclease RusA
MIELILPWPPSVNHYKNIGTTVTTKNGKIYQNRVNSPKTKLFYYEVWVKIRSWIALKTKAQAHDDVIDHPLTQPLRVYVYLYPPDARRRDIDNPIKVLLDSLQKGGLIQDDNQICRLVIERCAIIPKGQVIVRIEELLCT